MPRQARLDAPGVLQHVMARGIERRKIFWDDKDRKVPEVGGQRSEVSHRRAKAAMATERGRGSENNDNKLCERSQSI